MDNTMEHAPGKDRVMETPTTDRVGATNSDASSTFDKASSSDPEKATPPQPLPQDPTSPSLAPEEGLQGWLCVVGAGFGLFASFGFLNAIGVFQSTYQATTLSSYTPSDISWIFAVQLALMWIPGPLFGRIVDTFGPAPVMYPCAALCIGSLGATSVAHNYWQIFLAQGLGFGIGAGGVFTTCFVCVGQWFVKRRGLGIGLATAGSGLGGVIFPVYVQKIKDHKGFDASVRYTMLLVGITLIPAVLLVRARLPRKKWDRNTKWFDVNLFKEPKFAVYTAGSFLGMWGLWAPLDFLPSMAARSGFSDSMALYTISIVNTMSIPGRVLPPHLGDTLGYFNVLTVAAFMTGLSIITLWLPFDFSSSVYSTHVGLYIFGLVYGFSSGAFVSLLMPCVAKSGAGSGGVQKLGQRFGTFQMVIGVANLTGLPIMGAILARQDRGLGHVVEGHPHHFWGLQTFAGVSCLIGAAMIGLATCMVRKSVGNWKV